VVPTAVAGAPQSVADDIIAQCRDCGAGHFLAIFDRSAPHDQLAEAWELFGTSVIPSLWLGSVDQPPGSAFRSPGTARTSEIQRRN